MENSEELPTTIVAGGRRGKKPLETQNVENEHLARSSLTFLLIAIDRNGFRRMKEEGLIFASDFLIFAWGLSYDLSNFSEIVTPFFRLSKTIAKSLGKNEKI